MISDGRLSDEAGQTGMNWDIGRVVIAVVVAAIVIAVIVGMIVGTVRSTRGGADWSASGDRGFLPWNDHDDDT